MVLTFNGILHSIVDYFFHVLVAIMFVRIILQWLPIPQGHPFVRFFANITDPVLEPISRRVPHLSAGFLNIGYTIALIFMIWALLQLDTYIISALPLDW
jgi:uncharacterized protein YggT (Ycf19 family)